MKQTAYILFLFIFLLAAATPAQAHPACEKGTPATRMHVQSVESYACGGTSDSAHRHEAATPEKDVKCPCGHSKSDHGKSGHHAGGGHCCCCDHTGDLPAEYIPATGEDDYIPCAKEAAYVFNDILTVKAASANIPKKRLIREGRSIFSREWYATILSMVDDEEDSEVSIVAGLIGTPYIHVTA